MLVLARGVPLVFGAPLFVARPVVRQVPRRLSGRRGRRGSDGCRRTRASDSPGPALTRMSARAGLARRSPRASARCEASRLVPAGDQTVDSLQPTFGPDHQTRPAGLRTRTAPSARTAVSSARTTVVPTAITRPPHPCTAFDEPRGRLRHVELLGKRGLVALGRGDAGVQRDRRDQHAMPDQRRDQLGGERPPGARHLGAAGRRRVDVLVGLERPAARVT